MRRANTMCLAALMSLCGVRAAAQAPSASPAEGGGSPSQSELLWKKLEATLAQLRQVAPNSGALALIQADYEAQLGRLEDAVASLGKAVQHDKKNPDLWTAYASRLALRGEADEALMVLERAAAEDADREDLN